MKKQSSKISCYSHFTTYIPVHRVRAVCRRYTATDRYIPHRVLAVSHCVDTVSSQCHTARTQCRYVLVQYVHVQYVLVQYVRAQYVLVQDRAQ